MPLPKKKHTRSQRNRRRSHLALKVLNITACLKCGQAVLPHQACKNCGTYMGREVIDVMKKLTKREQKKRRRELHDQEEHAKSEKPMNAEELSRK